MIDAMNERQTAESTALPSVLVPLSARTAAGVYMDGDRAITISAIWRAVSYIAQTVGRMPWRLKKGPEVQPSHPVDYLLNKRPCFEWSSMQFRETMIHWAIRRGNGYAEVERDTLGRPVAIWPIHPTRVQVCRDLETSALFYRVSGTGGAVDLEMGDMFHLRGFGESVVGIDVMAYAAQSLGWAKAAQTFGAKFFGNGGQLQAVIQSKRALSPEGLAALRTEWRSRMAGGGDGPAFLDADMDYKPISIEPEKGQFLQTQVFLLEEACRWIGVPPHKIYDLSRATFTNIEHQNIEVVEDALRPWTKRLEDEADFKLLGQNRQNYATCIDLETITRADTTARMAYYQGLRNIGALNVNEIREDEGRGPIGPAGEKYTMQSGMTTLETIGEKPEPEPVPAEPEPVPAEPEPVLAEPEPDGNASEYVLLLNAITNAGGRFNPADFFTVAT